jgi:hypothetical protein
MDPKAKSPTDDSDQFLLAEHRHFTESLWKNEEVGEKRLNVFITLVTAVITALVALHAKENVLLWESLSSNQLRNVSSPGLRLCYAPTYEASQLGGGRI